MGLSIDAPSTSPSPLVLALKNILKEVSLMEERISETPTGLAQSSQETLPTADCPWRDNTLTSVDATSCD
jgi:hypothetical protein